MVYTKTIIHLSVGESGGYLPRRFAARWISTIIIHQIFSLTRDWSKRVTWPNIPQLKTVEYPRIFPNFENCARCEKDLKDNKDNSRHLGQKYARIFVLGHYLFLVADSFPRASLSENCSLLGTDNVRGQISVHIFAPNDGYCLYIYFCKCQKLMRKKAKRTSKL